MFVFVFDICRGSGVGGEKGKQKGKTGGGGGELQWFISERELVYKCMR
jgi:hypothetical protein